MEQRRECRFTMGSAASRQLDAEQNMKGVSASANRRRSCVPDPVTVVETPRDNMSAARMDMIKQQVSMGLHDRTPSMDDRDEREHQENLRTMVSGTWYEQTFYFWSCRILSTWSAFARSARALHAKFAPAVCACLRGSAKRSRRMKVEQAELVESSWS